MIVLEHEVLEAINELHIIFDKIEKMSAGWARELEASK